MNEFETYDNVSFFNPSCQKFVYIRDENKNNKKVEE